MPKVINDIFTNCQSGGWHEVTRKNLHTIYDSKIKIEVDNCFAPAQTTFPGI